MKPANFILLYVDSVAESCRFYQTLLNTQPVEASSTFAMFVLPGGFKLGLWDKRGVEPAPSGATGDSEFVFSCETDDEVDAVHQDWHNRTVTILQAPTTMDFGRTFTAADPDGHRIRVYHVADNPV
ncbi:VOC family protein [Affinirhizobium pseudoryzae]|uniref:VOC family protein n=1 Tax=Allorhizobium pseudoryzae TaxID=379684 RepID=UPI0013EBB32C|nr:VOC family protein [Allorhizobium pseudoryzae]